VTSDSDANIERYRCHCPLSWNEKYGKTLLRAILIHYRIVTKAYITHDMISKAD
jgi:hypothetical protein